MTSLAIITGASKGFGREIAIALAHKLESVDLVLVSRSESGLQQTKELVTATAPSANVHTYSCDLSDLDHIESHTSNWLKIAKPLVTYKTAYLINNHGSLEINKLASTAGKLQLVRHYIDSNVTSTVVLCSNFVATLQREAPGTQLFVVNISSLWALHPSPSVGLYCLGKAARDMLHAVLALEETSVRVLNYAPGPLDTDMQQQLRETDSPLQAMFATMKAEGKLVPPAKSAEVLVRLLVENTFKSGAHVDYFDIK